MIELSFLEFLEVLKLSRFYTGCSLLEMTDVGTSQIGQNWELLASLMVGSRPDVNSEHGRLHSSKNLQKWDDRTDIITSCKTNQRYLL